jgi:uncharacterized protein (DUF952 family)
MLFHITKQAHWEKNQDQMLYFPESFDSEGFIHLSTSIQVDGVLERYFQNQKDLILLCIDETLLDKNLVFEPSTSGELFPHLYGGLPVAAISNIEKIK